MQLMIISVLVLSAFHLLLGFISICVGVVSMATVEVRLDHHISPIWCGTLFMITGILGFICAKLRSAYPIIWFTAINVGSLVVAIIDIQLQYRGREARKHDSATSESDTLDALTDVALGTAGCECFVCMASFIASCSLAKASKRELQKQREDTFQIENLDGPSQDYAASQNDDFYRAPDRCCVAEVPDEERFVSLSSARQEPSDFLMTWDLSANGSPCRQLASCSDAREPAKCTVCPRPPYHAADIRGPDDERAEPEVNSPPGEDDPAVYTISSKVQLQSDEHISESPLENNNGDVDVRNELFLTGEKPKLKRILSLIEGECGTSYTSTNNNGT